MPEFPLTNLPEEVAALGDLALDLRWTWSHEADALWQQIEAEAWAQTRNPWSILQEISSERLGSLAADPVFCAELARLAEAREAYLGASGWFAWQK